jgi:class 3 adenylate cyclase
VSGSSSSRRFSTLLVLLIANSHRVVTRDEIIEVIWGRRIVSEAALSSRIAAARKAIGDDGKSQSLIRTIQRRGFRFVGPFSIEPLAEGGELAARAAPSAPDARLARDVPRLDRVPEPSTEATNRDIAPGERKQATVLCADIRDSLERTAERDPEEALKILDAVLKLMRQAIQRYEGSVNVVTGDGIIALFGVPVAQQDHAVRACYAALPSRGRERYARELNPAADVPVLVRAGLNSGEVVTRLIASDMNAEYRAMGYTTHVAARLGQIARPGTLLLSAETLRLAEGHVEVKRLDPVDIADDGERDLQRPSEAEAGV